MQVQRTPNYTHRCLNTRVPSPILDTRSPTPLAGRVTSTFRVQGFRVAPPLTCLRPSEAPGISMLPAPGHSVRRLDAALGRRQLDADWIGHISPDPRLPVSRSATQIVDLVSEEQCIQGHPGFSGVKLEGCPKGGVGHAQSETSFRGAVRRRLIGFSTQLEFPLRPRHSRPRPAVVRRGELWRGVGTSAQGEQASCLLLKPDRAAFCSTVQRGHRTIILNK